MTRDASYYIGDSAIQGKGLFARRDISPYACIVDVLGEKMTPEEIESEGIFSKKSANAYRFSRELYISPAGDASELANHSCSPNSYISKMDDALHICAGDSIAANSEILIDYSTIMAADDFWEMNCSCGSAKCRGLIKRFVDMPESIQVEYKQKGWVPRYILEI